MTRPDVLRPHAAFLRRAEAYFGLPTGRVRYELHPGTPDIAAIPARRTVLLGRRWLKSPPTSQEIKLTHELAHLGAGLQHNDTARSLGYYSNPRRDRWSRAVHADILAGTPRFDPAKFGLEGAPAMPARTRRNPDHGILFVIGRPKRSDTTRIQSILFDKAAWTPAQARAWLSAHDFLYGGMDEGGAQAEHYRFRQREPREFQADSFRTIAVGRRASNPKFWGLDDLQRPTRKQAERENAPAPAPAPQQVSTYQELAALPYAQNKRDYTIRRIRAGLKKRSKMPWSVTGGRGTAYGWISIRARNATHSMTESERRELAQLLNLPQTGQEVMVPSGNDYYAEYIDRAEGRTPSAYGKQYWDNPLRNPIPSLGEALVGGIAAGAGLAAGNRITQAALDRLSRATATAPGGGTPVVQNPTPRQRRGRRSNPSEGETVDLPNYRPSFRVVKRQEKKRGGLFGGQDVSYVVEMTIPGGATQKLTVPEDEVKRRNPAVTKGLPKGGQLWQTGDDRWYWSLDGYKLTGRLNTPGGNGTADTEVEARAAMKKRAQFLLSNQSSAWNIHQRNPDSHAPQCPSCRNPVAVRKGARTVTCRSCGARSAVHR